MPDTAEKKTVFIVLPSYEPTAKGCTLLEALRSGLSAKQQLLIVNDGSASPESADFFRLATELPFCTILQHPQNQGKGAALKTAFRYLLERYSSDNDFIGCITADCDCQHSPEDILQIAAQLQKFPDTLILGSRALQDRSVPWKSRLGNRLSKIIFRMLLHLPLNDPQTGLRGIPRKLMQKSLQLDGNGFEFESQMIAAAGKLPCPIREYNIQTIYFEQNQHTNYRMFADSLKIALALLRKYN